MLLHHEADLLGPQICGSKKIIFKSSMVLYKSSVSIQPSNFSIVERKLI